MAARLLATSWVAHVDGAVDTLTVTFCSTAGVPHHRGFRTSTACPVGVTDCTAMGPADRSMAGLKVSNPWFQPTALAMWAGTMWSNRTRQSVKGVEKVTVTVLPPWLGTTDWTSRYPSVEATRSGRLLMSRPSPLWDCQA